MSEIEIIQSSEDLLVELGEVVAQLFGLTEALERLITKPKIRQLKMSSFE